MIDFRFFRPFIIFIFLSIPGIQATAQVERSQWHFRYFNLESGLTSNEVYQIKEDRKGHIWICTDNGISRFNGVGFEHFISSDWSPIVLCSTIDEKGTLWFLTLNGELLFYDEPSHKIVRELNVKSLVSDFNGSASFFRVEGNQILIGGRYSLLRLEKSSSKGWVVQQIKTDKGEVWLQLDQTFSTISARSLTSPMRLMIYADGDSIGSFQFEIDAQKERRTTLVENKEAVYIQVANRIIRVNRDDLSCVSVDLKHELTPSIALDMENRVWVGTKNNGAYSFSADSLVLHEHVLEGQSITSIVNDKSGNTWFGTLRNGLALVMDRSVQHFLVTNDRSLISASIAMGDLVFLGTSDGSIYSIDQESKTWSKTLLHSVPGSIDKLFFLDTVLVAQSKKNYHQFDTILGKYSGVMDEDKAKLRNRRLVTERSSLVYHSIENNRNLVLDSSWGAGWIRHSFNFEKRGIYFGNFQGTYFYQPSSDPPSQVKQVARADLRCGILLNGDTVLLGTKGHGLMLAKNGNLLGSLHCQQHDLSRVLGLVKHQKSIWITTNNGMYRVIEIKNQKVVCEAWNGVFGQKNVDIVSVESIGNYLMINSTLGTFIFNPKEVNLENTPPVIQGVEFHVGDSVFRNDTQKAVFNYPISNISIYPETRSYSNAFNVPFRYRVTTLDNMEWHSTLTLPIEIPSLPIGEHIVQIQAQNSLGYWSVSPGEFKILILPPFWRTTWFVALIIVAFVLAVVLLATVRIGILKRKSKLEMELLESRNLALSLQLNPHFVFNSLNSVSAFISENNGNSALRYLAKFAKIMRNIFENSQHKFITLREEFTAIERYIELESLRLSNRFIYSINVQAEVMVDDWMIPPLVVQPVVENSIWHGVAKLPANEGEIAFVIEKLGKKSLGILIKDNGPGEKRNEHPRIQKKRISSLELIKQRFELLNRHYNNLFTIECRSDPEKGFAVQITIPVISKASVQK